VGPTNPHNTWSYRDRLLIIHRERIPLSEDVHCCSLVLLFSSNIPKTLRLSQYTYEPYRQPHQHNCKIPRMYISAQKLTLYCLVTSATAQAVQDLCPKAEYACLDVINSSQCIEQLVLEKQAPVTREALIKCVEYEGTVTTLPGATKVSFGSRRRLRWAKEFGLTTALI
jgi:hypothetical protein